MLTLVAGQDVEPGDEEGNWRIAQWVAPDRVISTVDPKARHMQAWRDADVVEDYRRRRSMVERSVAWLVFGLIGPFATEASVPTSSGCRCGWRRSTCDGC